MSGKMLFLVVLLSAVFQFAMPVTADEPEPGSLYSASAALIDADTGRMLYGKDPDKRMAMASTTKIMTCILVLEKLKSDQVCRFSAYAASQPRVRLGAEAGAEFLCRDLLYSLMLESHNDTAVALAEAAGGSTEGFAAMMNEKVGQIGLTQTHFVTPNGLDDPGHYTTARELALILRYCIMQSPKRKEFLEITRTMTYSFTDTAGVRSYSLNNTNALLSMMDGALAGKTGFTGTAGYCYTAAVEKEGRIFIVSLLACGWPGNRGYKWSDTRKLIDYGEDRFSLRELEIPRPVCGKIEVVDGCFDFREEQKAQVGIRYPELPDSLRKMAAENEEILIRVDLPDKLKAPSDMNEPCGRISCWLGEACVGEYEVYPDRSIDRTDYFWYLRKLLFSFYSDGL